MRGAILVLLLAGAGCASTSDRPESVAKPEIRITLPSTVFFGGGNTAGVSVLVDIINRADVPLTVREIELTSPGMVQYRLEGGRQTFAETIPPGGTHRFTVFATAYATVRSPNEPLTVRVTTTFRAAGVTFREIEHL